ncbi:MAG: glycine--tRNA ligase subunit beta [bacterium]
MAARKTAKRADLLIEIGTEELPPKALSTLARAFAAELARALADAGVLADARDNHRCFATPRRLGALLYAVALRQPDRVVERRGPSLQAAYDAHRKPTAAAIGFAKSCGVAVSELGELKNEKGAWLMYRQAVAGAPLATIVTDCLAQSLRRLPIPKRMRWGDGDAEFVRPAHWLLALHGDKVIKTQALGLKSGRVTRGHRFHANHELRIARVGEYERVLESEGKVIADFAKRRGRIERQIAKLAQKANARAPTDGALLDLVTGLVESPQALLGEFDQRFLKLPDEVLISAMRDHQKYFHLLDARGKLLWKFIAVSNLVGGGASAARVRQGNERVLRARLADAEFFWNSDRKIPLEKRVEDLRGILFHRQLGTLHDKTERVVELARVIAAQIGADAEKVALAARLCKADLSTDMVGEFPALQGTIGRYYAKSPKRVTGKPPVADSVANAIEQHYWPRHADDELPQSSIARCVALADRIDSLLGLFAVGEAPSGDKDPFALRRAALGVLRILIERNMDLDLRELLDAARRIYADAGITLDAANVDSVFAFVFERLKGYYQSRGYSAAEIASVMACAPSRPFDFNQRLEAVSSFFKARAEAAESLAAANKRIVGILKSIGDSVLCDNESDRYDESLFQHPAERELASKLEEYGSHARKHFDENRYGHGLTTLSKLKKPVDTFFDQVMVLDDDPKVRANRLALLRRIRRLFLSVADISHMHIER